MAHRSTSPASTALTLDKLQRIRRWHVAHSKTCPLEYQIWDALMTLWIMGWAGWLPVFVLDTPFAYLLCLLGMVGPELYVRWRARAHASGRLRCDWLELAH